MSKASSKVGKGIDWEYLNKVVTSAEGKSKMHALRRAYDDIAGTIQEKFTIRPPSINWDFYRERLGPHTVNIFESSVNSLDKEIPEYECEFTDDYKAKHRKSLLLAEEKESDSKKRIIAIDKELARLKEEKVGMATLTVDEYFHYHPDVKEKIDDEIRNHYWG